jgi:hypothetical protein
MLVFLLENPIAFPLLGRPDYARVESELAAAIPYLRGAAAHLL